MSNTERMIVKEIADTIHNLTMRVSQIERFLVFGRNNENGVRFSGDVQADFLRLGKAAAISLRNPNTPKIVARGNDTNATFFEVFFDRLQNALIFEVGCQRDTEGGGINNPTRAIHREMTPNSDRDAVRPVMLALSGGNNDPSTAFFGLQLYTSGPVLSDPTGMTFATSGGLAAILWAGYDRDANNWRYQVNAGWQIFSDARLKRNIRPFTTTIGELQPKQFKRIDSAQEEVGFVAQEVEQVLPEAVGELDGVKTVKETVILAALVNTVQELSRRVDKLSKRLEKLEWKHSTTS